MRLTVPTSIHPGLAFPDPIARRRALTLLFMTALSTATLPTLEAAATDDPLLTESTLPFHLPRFDRIKDEQFPPAFERAMAEQLDEVALVANESADATFENTIVAMERTGQTLTRVQSIFSGLNAAHTNPALQKIETEIAPKLAAQRDAILLNAKLFSRIESLHTTREQLPLDPESKFLVERYYKDFVRAGAKLSEAEKTRLKALNAELATLQTTFQQNVLKEVNAATVFVEDRAELKGFSENAIAAAAAAAEADGKKGQYALRLLNTSGQPALSSLENRALRQRLHETSLARNSHGGAYDNREIVARIAKLRAEHAQLLGYANHAAYVLEDQTALTTDAVNKLLTELAGPAVANARSEAADMQSVIDRSGASFPLAAWDWDYYSEKVRQERFAFDEEQLKPYFELNRVLHDGVFFAATKLFGITFKERQDLPVYQEDVRVFEVFDADGQPLALFLADFFARPSKRGGAWMNSYVDQSTLLEKKPVIGNNQNISKPAAGAPALLTFDEVNTMFHEFGHALHGMFSQVSFPRFSGTEVPRDFVEFPSQVYEMWAIWPEVLKNYAKHHQTGEPMPAELIEKVIATEQFNQGFATTEYLAAALLDQTWHQLAPAKVPEASGVLDFEAGALKNAAVDLPMVPPRYRSTYFSHSFSGGYSAAYYSYIWAEVLDADSVEWFKQNGGLTRQNGDHFRRTVLSRGGTAEAITLFRDFKGSDPQIGPLLKRRGLGATGGK
ncbi:MAG: Peptidyl-dipeptidase Dcp [Chthoniobacter sp.]|nr:Peptidyl-dipeptidase Dcp [Chthoniobacter sp.]